MRLAEQGDRASLGMTLLKLTSPGVPDIYQGDELPFLALVDPDNRRPVDWELRRRLLASGEPPAKLDLIRRTLALRERRPAAFASTYEPVEAGEDVCAFLRGGEVLVAVAVRGDLSAFQPPSGTWDDVVPDAAPASPSSSSGRSSSAARRARAGRRRRPAGRTASRRSAPAGAAPRPEGSARRYGRSVVIAWKASHAKMIRASSGISSPAFWSG